MQTTTRYERLDALRGLWMLWMVAFHFAFDLAHLGLITANFYADPVWTGQRTLILSGFLVIAGVSQGVGQPQGPRFWRRWAQVAGAATLVSLGSAWMFPRSWISFGVLHAVAVMLPLVRWGLLKLPSGALLMGAVVAVALPWWVAHPVFNSRWLNPLGLVTHKPITEDYVPLLPWVAPVLVGLALARAPVFLRAIRGRAPAALVKCGQWPLSVYLLHQPLLLGLIYLYLMATRS
ncbi:heparan-alpha-glucosaminide N-acetyltransferase [Inhella gelatinilytica]|uniref:DUF1624 domain-containing protein n=1 Tax=Inhella gelatinilytica TaxID=2795030 RepID=A0A931IUC4_9BURK|nr:heparan-alpha-glucosaminide N-acetyltransferase [Inhella gelatinilytica]MBH9552937.1 DUF1624 domain-containing protein [Inhella gelatinilytica]